MNLIRTWGCLAWLAASLATPALAQSRIATMPGYAQWAEVSGQISGSVTTGAITPLWSKDSKSFEYEHAGVRWRYDLTTGQTSQLAVPENDPPAAGPAASTASSSGLVLARGRGREADALSPMASCGRSRAARICGSHRWMADRKNS